MVICSMEVSPRTHLFRDLAFILKCPICHEIMDKCVVNSSCGHSFCRKCASHHVTVHHGTSCPVCRQDIEIFSHNYIVNDIIEKLMAKGNFEEQYTQKKCESRTTCNICDRSLYKGDEIFYKTRKVNGKTIPTLTLCRSCKY